MTTKDNRARETMWKRAAAQHAVEWLRPGMVIGLGAGSTAEVAMQLVAELLARGQLSDITGVPCSRASPWSSAPNRSCVRTAAARFGSARPAMRATIPSCLPPGRKPGRSGRS